jgi:hypothetical protein
MARLQVKTVITTHHHHHHHHCDHHCDHDPGLSQMPSEQQAATARVPRRPDFDTAMAERITANPGARISRDPFSEEYYSH